MPHAYVLIFDGYADWEIGYVLAELRRFGKQDVVTFGFTDDVVTSMGGLRIIPDQVLGEVDIRDVMILILPGGELWQGSYPETPIQGLLQRLAEAQTPIAAICGATTALAKAGLLADRRHTSNALSFLKQVVPEYADQATYVETLAARDRHIITASGLGAIEFTVEIFNELDLATPEVLTVWYDAFKHGINPASAESDDES